MTKQEWIEENRDALEQRYHEAYMMTLGDCFEGMDEAFTRFERALVEMGILEDEDEPEATSEATNWDEWMIDNAVDREREERMAYEI